MIKTMKLFALLATVLSLFAAAACTVQSGAKKTSGKALEPIHPAGSPSGPQADFRPGEILVRFKASIPPETLEGFCTDMHLSVLHRFTSPSLFLFSIKDGKTVPEKIQEAQTHPLVAYAEPNYLFSLDPPRQKPAYKPGEVLVRFAPKTEKTRLEAVLEELGMEIVEAFPLPNLFRVKAKDPTVSVEAMVKHLNALPEVLYAEYNFIYTLESQEKKGAPLK